MSLLEYPWRRILTRLREVGKFTLKRIAGLGRCLSRLRISTTLAENWGSVYGTHVFRQLTTITCNSSSLVGGGVDICSLLALHACGVSVHTSTHTQLKYRKALKAGSITPWAWVLHYIKRRKPAIRNTLLSSWLGTGTNSFIFKGKAK